MVKHHLYKHQSTPFENFVLVVALLEPLSTLPQIGDIYRSKDAHSLSFLSWILFAAASVVWLVYGLKIKSKPLIASSLLWLATEIVLLVGIVLYS